jgi:uncharacterized membrane protein SpoIIM required for sporulation
MSLLQIALQVALQYPLFTVELVLKYNKESLVDRNYITCTLVFLLGSFSLCRTCKLLNINEEKIWMYEIWMQHVVHKYNCKKSTNSSLFRAKLFVPAVWIAFLLAQFILFASLISYHGMSN